MQALHSALSRRGEALVRVGEDFGHACSSESALEQSLQALDRAASSLNADAVEYHRASGVPDSDSDETSCSNHTADVEVRRRSNFGGEIEVRVACIGNVDSGKSTLIGVLTRTMLDDGRGGARAKVFRHGHEQKCGRTSSIGQQNLCYDSKGNVLNDTIFRANTCADYVAKSSKIVTFVDLAGHERYFKTTAFGLTAHLPDYACLLVSANQGVIGMCKEHLGIALAMKIPVFVVMTKCDMAPDPVRSNDLATVMKQSLKDLKNILKKPGVRKSTLVYPFLHDLQFSQLSTFKHALHSILTEPYIVQKESDLIMCARNMSAGNVCPIFLTSSVDGRGLNAVRNFLNLIEQRQDWSEECQECAEFIIDETFSVTGVGTVVAGTLKKGIIRENSRLLLGPDIGDGSFKQTAVKSIHYKRMPVSEVRAGQTAALALKKVKRNAVRKGMVLADEKLQPKASWEFDADIAILTHATTIQLRYQAVIHCEIIRQAARVIAMDSEQIRSGDRAAVRFRFISRPEYLRPGLRFVFREGRTKGIGCIIAAGEP